jgi:hypothetical protein
VIWVVFSRKRPDSADRRLHMRHDFPKAVIFFTQYAFRDAVFTFTLSFTQGILSLRPNECRRGY